MGVFVCFVCSSRSGRKKNGGKVAVRRTIRLPVAAKRDDVAMASLEAVPQVASVAEEVAEVVAEEIVKDVEVVGNSADVCVFVFLLFVFFCVFY
jgi:hypothetical protein